MLAQKMDKKSCTLSSLFRNQTAQKKHFYPGSSDEASGAFDHLDELLYLLILHSTNVVLEEKLPSSSVLFMYRETIRVTSIPVLRYDLGLVCPERSIFIPAQCQQGSDHGSFNTAPEHAADRENRAAQIQGLCPYSLWVWQRKSFLSRMRVRRE